MNRVITKYSSLAVLCSGALVGIYFYDLKRRLDANRKEVEDLERLLLAKAQERKKQRFLIAKVVGSIVLTSLIWIGLLRLKTKVKILLSHFE